MSEPWIEVEPCSQTADDFDQGCSWQASFAVVLCVPGFSEWVALKWGFNAAALLDEAMERQKLFIESHHAVNRDLQMEYPEHRTLAFRYMAVPNMGVLPVIVAKVKARTNAEATRYALAFYRKLRGTLPYEYSVSPVATKEDYYELSGKRLLSSKNGDLQILQIKRCEQPLRLSNSIPFIQGFWNSSARAHELVWRLLSNVPHPTMLSFMLRPTVLYERESDVLWGLQKQAAETKPSDEDAGWTSLYSTWSGEIIKRRLAPWKKFYYLQIFMASNHEIEEDAAQGIGAVLTLNDSTLGQPGYEIVRPQEDQAGEWVERVSGLDVLLAGSRLPVPRLSEVVDLDEAFAAIRLPYSPPENGLPGVKFITSVGG